MRTLEKLTIKNFKSIREQTLELGRLNVFIGGNGAGKSNLIEAFRFLREISSPTELPRALCETRKQNEFEAIRAAVSTPEEINELPEFAPSKRIINMFPAYKKTLHGPTVAARIGLDQIRKECPHFNEWINKLARYPGSNLGSGRHS